MISQLNQIVFQRHKLLSFPEVIWATAAQRKNVFKLFFFFFLEVELVSMDFKHCCCKIKWKHEMDCILLTWPIHYWVVFYWKGQWSCSHFGYFKITESQNHRIVGAGRHLQRSSSPTPLQSRPPTAGYTGRHPGRSWISPEEENPQSPWAACSSSPSPSLWRSSFTYWCRTSYAPVYGHFPLSCPHRPLKRGWPCLLDSHT